jgi:hypothetical protein
MALAGRMMQGGRERAEVCVATVIPVVRKEINDPNGRFRSPKWTGGPVRLPRNVIDVPICQFRDECECKLLLAKIGKPIDITVRVTALKAFRGRDGATQEDAGRRWEGISFGQGDDVPSLKRWQTSPAVVGSGVSAAPPARSCRPCCAAAARCAPAAFRQVENRRGARAPVFSLPVSRPHLRPALPTVITALAVRHSLHRKGLLAWSRGSCPNTPNASRIDLSGSSRSMLERPHACPGTRRPLTPASVPPPRPSARAGTAARALGRGRPATSTSPGPPPA